MMKRVLILALSIIMAISLAACSKTKYNDNENQNPNINQEEQTTSSIETFDLKEVYNSILASQEDSNGLTLFEETDDEIIESFYPGISDIALKQKAFYFPPIAGFACEIALVEVEDSKDVEKVKQIFNDRIKTGATTEGCDPGIEEVWERNAKVQSEGNYVCMVALPDEYKIPEKVFSK